VVSLRDLPSFIMETDNNAQTAFDLIASNPTARDTSAAH